MTERYEMLIGIRQFKDNKTDKTYCEYNLEDVVELLNDYEKENEQLKQQLTKTTRELMIEQFTINEKEMELQHDQRITQLTNAVLTAFIESKGYTYDDVAEFLDTLPGKV